MFLPFKSQIFLEIIKDFILALIGLSFSVSIKGFVKALVARFLGDRTPQNDGFLTLNPMGHCDLPQITLITLIFITFSRIVYGSASSSLLTMIIISFMESAIYTMNFDTRAHKADIKISIIQLSGIITSLTLFLVPIPLMLKIANQNSGPLFSVFYDILANVAIFSFIRLIIHLPPIPPREGFYVIQPFISQKIERFLVRISENLLASIFFSLVSAIILFPAVVMAFNLSLSTTSMIFNQIKDFVLQATITIIGFVKSAISMLGF